MESLSQTTILIYIESGRVKGNCVILHHAELSSIVFEGLSLKPYRWFFIDVKIESYQVITKTHRDSVFRWTELLTRQSFRANRYKMPTYKMLPSYISLLKEFLSKGVFKMTVLQYLDSFSFNNFLLFFHLSSVLCDWEQH